MPLEPVEIACLAATTTAGQARRQIEYRMTDWGLGGRHYAELRGDVLLVAAELVVNACAETPEAPIRVRFAAESGAVWLGVWDSSNEAPKPKPVAELEPEDLDLDPAHFDSNGGWGLPLVMALASECGLKPTPPQGKWVWARFKIS